MTGHLIHVRSFLPSVCPVIHGACGIIRHDSRLHPAVKQGSRNMDTGRSRRNPARLTRFLQALGLIWPGILTKWCGIVFGYLFRCPQSRTLVQIARAYAFRHLPPWHSSHDLQYFKEPCLVPGHGPHRCPVSLTSSNQRIVF